MSENLCCVNQVTIEDTNVRIYVLQFSAVVSE